MFFVFCGRKMHNNGQVLVVLKRLIFAKKSLTNIFPMLYFAFALFYRFYGAFTCSHMGIKNRDKILFLNSDCVFLEVFVEEMEN